MELSVWSVVFVSFVLAPGVFCPELPIYEWRHRFPEPYPVEPGVRGFDFLINKTFMTWQWNLPQLRKIPRTPKDKILSDKHIFMGIQYMTMEFWAPHNGWVGAGFCQAQHTKLNLDGKMQDCDFIVTWVDQVTGKGYACDFFTYGNDFTPTVDVSQDVRIVNAEYEHGQTLITIERDMETDDEQDWSLWLPFLLSWAHMNDTAQMKSADGKTCTGLPAHKWDMSRRFEVYGIYLWKPLKRREDPTTSTSSEDPGHHYDYSAEHNIWQYGKRPGHTPGPPSASDKDPKTFLKLILTALVSQILTELINIILQ